MATYFIIVAFRVLYLRLAWAVGRVHNASTRTRSSRDPTCKSSARATLISSDRRSTYVSHPRRVASTIPFSSDSPFALQPSALRSCRALVPFRSSFFFQPARRTYYAYYLPPPSYEYRSLLAAIFLLFMATQGLRLACPKSGMRVGRREEPRRHRRQRHRTDETRYA